MKVRVSELKGVWIPCAEPFHQQGQMFQSLRAVLKQSSYLKTNEIGMRKRPGGGRERSRECMPLFSHASNILHLKTKINSEKRHVNSANTLMNLEYINQI